LDTQAEVNPGLIDNLKSAGQQMPVGSAEFEAIATAIRKLTEPPAATIRRLPSARVVDRDKVVVWLDEANSDEYLKDVFSYHAVSDHPDPNVADRYEVVRLTALHFAQVIRDHTPPGVECAQAIASVREASMWANQGIALEQDCDGTVYGPKPIRKTSEQALREFNEKT